jgi:hypothetical protein
MMSPSRIGTKEVGTMCYEDCNPDCRDANYILWAACMLDDL